MFLKLSNCEAQAQQKSSQEESWPIGLLKEKKTCVSSFYTSIKSIKYVSVGYFTSGASNYHCVSSISQTYKEETWKAKIVQGD